MFNKNDNGSQELKDALGFIDASVDYSEITPFIRKKKRVIVSLISSAVYDMADAHYNSDIYNQSGQVDPAIVELDMLVILIQAAQSAYAWHEFAPFKDLSHTASGRRLRVDGEHERIPSDRLFKKSDEQILQLAHSAMDELLKFLDECTEESEEGEPATIKEVWRATQHYNLRIELFVSTLDEFETVFPLFGSYRMFAVLTPFLKEVQRDYIKGSFAVVADYNSLVASKKAGTLTAAEILILEKARVPMVFLSLAMAAKRLSAQILDKGIFRNVLTEEAVDAEKQPVDATFYSIIVSTMEAEAEKGLAILREHFYKLKVEAEGEIYEYIPAADSVDTTKKFIKF